MVTQTYHDLCREIDILEVRIRDLENEYKFWYRACFGGNTRKQFPLDICLARMKEICDQVEMYAEMAREKDRARKEIEQHMSEFEGLEYKVSYMRDIEGKSLAEIAADLGYSYHWISKISAKIGKKKAKCS